MVLLQLKVFHILFVVKPEHSMPNNSCYAIVWRHNAVDDNRAGTDFTTGFNPVVGDVRVFTKARHAKLFTSKLLDQSGNICHVIQNNLIICIRKNQGNINNVIIIPMARHTWQSLKKLFRKTPRPLISIPLSLIKVFGFASLLAFFIPTFIPFWSWTR